MRRVRLVAEAADELKHAALWYEKEVPGLGIRFINTVENAINLLKDDSSPLVPVLGKPANRGVKANRAQFLPLFNSRILPKDHEISVVALAYYSRKPIYRL